MIKILGVTLSIFAVVQAYIWIFGFVSFSALEAGCYFVMLCAQFVIGLLMHGVLYVK